MSDQSLIRTVKDVPATDLYTSGHRTCAGCGAKNTNARVQNTCLAWCREAAACVGNRDIDEWVRMQEEKRKS